MSGRPWTEYELDFVRNTYGRFSADEIGQEIDRSQRAVYQAAFKLGVASRNLTKDARAKLNQQIRRRLAQGWSDAEIAAEAKCSRRWIQDIRRAMGLPASGRNERYRRRVAENTRKQVQAAGVKSLADVRAESFRRFAAEQGWPRDLRPRHVQILNILHQHGPKTRRDLADLMGLDWHGSRASLKSCDSEGSYLAHLMARGLVVSLGKLAKGKGKGHSRCVYTLPLHIRPQKQG